jgi:hypothetical protein
MTDAALFLQALFGEVLDGWHAVFSLPSRSARWYAGYDFEQAAAAAELLSGQGQDVYTTVAFFAGPRGSDDRGNAQDAAGIVGLWLDLDVNDPAHKKVNYPPTLEDALALLDATGLQPSLVLHSGHGVHAWWLFREPWQFETAEEREQAADLAQRWQETVRVLAGRHGWAVDSTHDLARVLRIPGTQNHKDPSNPLPVALLWPQTDLERRYNPSDFLEHLLEPDPAPAAATAQGAALPPQQPVDVGGLVFDPQADPPSDKFDALESNVAEFRSAWRHTTKKGDHSLSGYDMALANYAAMASWTDQEIMNLLIAHRRNWGTDDDVNKLRRDDYLQSTISKARQRAGTGPYIIKKSSDEDPLLTDVRRGMITDPEEVAKAKEAWLTTIREIWRGVPVECVFLLSGEPLTYTIVINGKEIFLGEAKQLLNQDYVGITISRAILGLPEQLKRGDWRIVVSCMIAAAKEIPVGESATTVGRVRGWLSNYLVENKPESRDGNAAATQKHPFTNENEKVVVFFTDFYKWLQTEKVNLTYKQLADMGYAFKVIARTEVFIVGGKEKKEEIWILPYNPEAEL